MLLFSLSEGIGVAVLLPILQISGRRFLRTNS